MNHGDQSVDTEYLFHFLRNHAPLGVKINISIFKAHWHMCAVQCLSSGILFVEFKQRGRWRERENVYLKVGVKREKIRKKKIDNGLVEVWEHSHGSHVVFRQQRDLQKFGVGLHDFMAGGGNSFASDAVDLVEGMWSQEAVVCGAYEQLQGEWLAFHVAIKLLGEQRDPGESQHHVLRPPSQTTPHLGNRDWMHISYW